MPHTRAARLIQVEGVSLRVVCHEDFIASKKAFGRSIDLRDIEEL
jgi:hypothetical protein